MHDLLFLVQRIPYPPTKGEKIRHYHLLRHLAGRYRVHLGCFVDDPADFAHVPTVSAMVDDTCVIAMDRRRARMLCLRGLVTREPLSLPYFHDRALSQWVAHIAETARPWAAVACSSAMAQYLLALPPALRPGRIVLDYGDVDPAKWDAYAAASPWPQRWIYAREASRLLAFERRAAAIADTVTFVSDAETDLFRRLAPEVASRVVAVANGVDADYFSPERDYACPYQTARPAIVFTGTMDYRPNVDAVEWFTREVWPEVRRHLSAAEFWIVGANPAPAVTALGGLPGVRVSGRVADVRPYLAHAALAVAPLRIARGLQNKVLEAMAMARPVVVTSAALEGIDAVPGHELVLADGPRDTVAAILRLVGTPAEAAALGAAARHRVVTDYTWAPRLAAFDHLLTRPISGESGHTADRDGQNGQDDHDDDRGGSHAALHSG